MVNQKFYQLGTAPSVIRELFAYGLEQAQVVGPENVFDYSLGNPSIPAPAKVNQSIHDILNDTDSIKVHGYSMACGFDAAREAIAANLNRRFGMELKPGNLFLTCGAAPGLIAVIKALLAEEDSEIMAVAPFFPEYRPFTESNGGHLVVVPADTDAFQIDLDQVERRLTPRTQAIIINSPNNPSGVVYTRQTLEGLARLLERKGAEYGHPIYIIADEPYRELVYGGVEVPFIPTVYRNTIVCYSYSKSLSLPGERIGYICVPDFVEDHQAVYNAIAGAARSCGMNGSQAMRYIIMPQAVKNILPAIGNEFVTMVKETSIIQYLGISDLMYNNGIVITATYNPLPCYYISALIYLTLNICLGKGLNIFEGRMKKSER